MLNIVFNHERIDLQKFGEEVLIKESKVYTKIFKTDLSYTQHQNIEINMNSIEDETDWFQYGQ